MKTAQDNLVALKEQLEKDLIEVMDEHKGVERTSRQWNTRSYNLYRKADAIRANIESIEKAIENLNAPLVSHP